MMENSLVLFDKKKSIEWYLSAEEQLANGIVHGIVSDLSEIEPTMRQFDEVH